MSSEEKRKSRPWKQNRYETPYERTWRSNCGHPSVTCGDRSKPPLHFREKSRKNRDLDTFTKRAAFKNRSCVVAVVTFLGGIKVFHGSGTVIEDGSGTVIEDGVIIVTSACAIGDRSREQLDLKELEVIVYLPDGNSVGGEVRTYDLYYNIAFIKIKPNAALSRACLRLVDDYQSLKLSDIHDDHADAVGPFSLVPGETTIALGRYRESPHDLMAAPGEFSIIRCPKGYDCKEFFSTNGVISSAGEGGPLINRHGEVIGVNFYDHFVTPFLPINIVCKWWNYYKKNGRSHQQPALGMELINFYAADISLIEKLIMKFPKYHAGVFVEQVIPGSCADSAGICDNDLIVGCCGKPVRSFLQLFDMMWEKVGGSVELVVLRVSDIDAPLRLNVACSVNA